MGAISALILSPCVAAPLAGALLYIAGSGDILLGGFALFALGLGMGAPLLAIGAGFASMPRPGAWMMKITQIFGFVMLGVAIWLLSRIIGDFAWILYGLLGVFAGVFKKLLNLTKMAECELKIRTAKSTKIIAPKIIKIGCCK